MWFDFLGVPPQKVDEEDDDDAADVDHGAPEAQRGNELPEGLEDGVRDLTGQVDNGVQKGREVRKPRRENSHEDRDVEHVENGPEDPRLHGEGRWSPSLAQTLAQPSRRLPPFGFVLLCRRPLSRPRGTVLRSQARGEVRGSHQSDLSRSVPPAFSPSRARNTCPATGCDSRTGCARRLRPPTQQGRSRARSPSSRAGERPRHLLFLSLSLARARSARLGSARFGALPPRKSKSIAFSSNPIVKAKVKIGLWRPGTPPR